MADRRPRQSTDQENAPLLSDDDEARNHNQSTSNKSYSDHIGDIAQEPLTPLTKVLLVIALALLLLSSVFIGLFAGAQHKLALGRKNPEDGGGDGNNGQHTITRTRTATEIDTVTATATKTSVKLTTSLVTTTISPSAPATETTTTTTTRVKTTTVNNPLPQPTRGPSKDLPCLTPECILISAAIISSLDRSKNPCDNFYEFANGGWIKSHPLPADKGSFGTFNYLAQQNQQVLQGILESDSFPDSFINAPGDKAVLSKIRDLYGSCMNEDLMDEIGSGPLRNIATKVRNLYQGKSTEVSSESEKKKHGLTAALAYLHSKGVDALFSFYMDGDIGVDPNHMSLWFSQPDLGLPSKEYYEDEATVKIYAGVIQEVLLDLTAQEEVDDNSNKASTVLVDNSEGGGWPRFPWPPWEGDDDDDDGGGNTPSNRTREVEKLAREVVKFEGLIANASLDLDILYTDPHATYNPVPLSNLTDTLTQIHFPTYFSTFAPRTFPEQVILTYPAYTASLTKLLDETAKEVVEAYLVTRAGLSLSRYLGKSTASWQAVRTLHETLTGAKKGAFGDRAEFCVGIVEQELGFAAGRYFVQEKFGGKSREKATKVITDTIQAFKEGLSRINWMDKKTATAAATKADALRVKVGYPTSPDTDNAEALARYYSRVQINKLGFFENVLSAEEAEQFRQWQTLGKPRDVNSWEMYPSMVNAYFNPPANEIVFPAGILQPPFFAQSWPSYLAYGAFGSVAAHELTHAFDNAGRQYDAHGFLREWWTEETDKKYQVKLACIVDQFSKYTIDDGKGGKLHLNGNLTAGENIGDSGLIQAYRAWKAQNKASEKAGTDYLLPGMEYTREQLFFIGFAQIWGNNIKPQTAIQRLRTDPHSPSQYRVDGTVSNMAEFAKAFNCPAGAKLNPPDEERCIFWGTA